MRAKRFLSSNPARPEGSSTIVSGSISTKPSRSDSTSICCTLATQRHGFRDRARWLVVGGEGVDATDRHQECGPQLGGRGLPVEGRDRGREVEELLGGDGG